MSPGQGPNAARFITIPASEGTVDGASPEIASGRPRMGGTSPGAAACALAGVATDNPPETAPAPRASFRRSRRVADGAAVLGAAMQALLIGTKSRQAPSGGPQQERGRSIAHRRRI